MKIKKKSIIIPAFALLIGASLAGSISGTVAWYQYSTRVNAAYVGVSGGTSGNLQLRIRKNNQAATDDWTSRLSISDVQTYLAATADLSGSAVQPITSGAMDKDSPLPEKFYMNPAYGLDGGYDGKWQEADATNFVTIPLQLRYVERDGIKVADVDDLNAAHEVFLSELLIQEDHTNTAGGKLDLSDAIRFHISSYSTANPTAKTNRLISKLGGTTVTHGQLDLDGDDNPDYKYTSDKYGFESDATSILDYGAGSQVAFSSETDLRSGTYYTPANAIATDPNVYPMVVESNGLDIVDSSKNYDTGKSKSIGSTVDSESDYLNVDITIWVEGWQTFEDESSKHTSIWSEDFINSKFNVGFEFAIDTVIE